MPESSSFKYDVALSLLHRDRAMAARLRDLLAPLSVFFYVHNQTEVAGGDGVETFSTVFRNESRLNVVLFRAGWGERGYTGIEATAIRERALKDKFESLFVVALEDNPTLPDWVPSTHIYISVEQFSLEQIAGAIRYRAVCRGATYRAETVVERAAREARARERRENAQRKVEQEGAAALQSEAAHLFALITAKCNEIRTAATRNIQAGYDANVCVLREDGWSISIFPYSGVVDSEFVRCMRVRSFDGSLLLPGQSGMTLRDPELVGERFFLLDFTPEFGWCWRERPEDNYLTTTDLADRGISQLLDLVAKGHRRRRSGFLE